MKKFNNLSVNDLLPSHSRPFPKLLWLVLILSFSLNIIAINWGLPSPSNRSWAADEITPSSVMNGIKMKFSNGWSAPYPPFHYYVLSAFYLPFYFLDALNIINLQSVFMTTLLFLIGRLISVFMGTGIVFLVYLCGCEVMEKKSALFIPLITALTPPFLYYSKTTNVDIPYIFWFFIAVYFFIRILKYHRTFDYILFAGAGVFSICTKDQAYALLILTPFIIIYSLHQRNKAEEKNPSILKSIVNKKTMSAFVTGTSLFVLIHNFMFNFQGFKKHLFFITGPSKGERDFPSDISGLFSMFIQTIKHLEFTLGLPFFLICIIGFIYALTKKEKYSLIFWLVLLSFSYCIFFLFIIGKNFVRFLMPIYILMSFFGALGVSYFLYATRRFRMIKSLLVVILFINAAIYSFSVDVAMVHDSRYYVEQWMHENIEKNESILFLGYMNFLPRNRGYTNVQYLVRASQVTIKEIDPSYILISSNLLKSTQPYLYQKLSNDNLGYKQILRYKSSPWLSLLPEHKIRIHENNPIITNLNLINPEIIILKKINLDYSRVNIE
jgi:hypothetical protein